ncbi:MAG: hypothetical protein J5689_02760 [Clostridia bacterium]|nr:hypothetical protein [Clostridia bacterium]
MTFSNDILKLGKSNMVNGFVDEGVLNIFYSKAKNKTSTKKINLNDGYKLSDFSEVNNCSELIMLNENIKIYRLGAGYKISVLSVEE